jgi:cob(I)alamin adenosyltransferase
VSGRAPDEPVRLTRIYTRGGDRGETSLGDGSRVSKLDRRVAAFGAVDELNAQLGVALADAELPAAFGPLLRRIQNELFDLGADLSVPLALEGRLRVTQEQIDELERTCDAFNEPLAELKSFVLPGGTRAAAQLHVARTVCRRAERPRRRRGGRGQPARSRLPESALGPALRARAGGQPGRQRAPLEAWRLALTLGGGSGAGRGPAPRPTGVVRA